MNTNEMTLSQALEYIARLADQFDTQAQAAETWGISDSYLSEVLAGKYPPGKKLLDAVNLEKVEPKYRKKRPR